MDEIRVNIIDESDPITIIVNTEETILQLNDEPNVIVNVYDVGLQGAPGSNGIGKSAYQVWRDMGNTGNEQDFIDSLKWPNLTIGPTEPVDPETDDLWIDTNV